MEAVCYSNKEAAARLLEANCDFNLREVKAGESALHVSVRKNYTTITDQLLAAGAALRPVYNYQVDVSFVSELKQHCMAPVTDDCYEHGCIYIYIYSSGYRTGHGC